MIGNKSEIGAFSFFEVVMKELYIVVKSWKKEWLYDICYKHEDYCEDYIKFRRLNVDFGFFGFFHKDTLMNEARDIKLVKLTPALKFLYGISNEELK